jgi:hypothetical protein
LLDDCEVWLSTREMFRTGDPGWDSYIRFIGLTHLREVRTIDSACNPCRGGNEPIYSLAELWKQIEQLSRPPSDCEYYLLFADAMVSGAAFKHPRLKLLGYDLSDDTWTSSLLNCGPWRGAMEPIAHRTGENGLLGWEDANLAQSLLPEAWNDDPHSFVTIWSLFEVVPPDEATA